MYKVKPCYDVAIGIYKISFAKRNAVMLYRCRAISVSCYIGVMLYRRHAISVSNQRGVEWEVHCTRTLSRYCVKIKLVLAVECSINLQHGQSRIQSQRKHHLNRGIDGIP